MHTKDIKDIYQYISIAFLRGLKWMQFHNVPQIQLNFGFHHGLVPDCHSTADT